MDYSHYIADVIEDYNAIQERVFPDDPSAAQNLSIHLTKILVMTCASTYEQRLQNAYIQYAQREA